MTSRAAIDSAARMTEAAAAWLDGLTAEQRAKATFSFDDEAERTSWAYFPRNHAGLPLLEMDVRQRKLAHVLISSALSLHAYAKVCAIMALESVLNHIEGRRADAVRDPGRYFISIFGSPGDHPWGWRLEGHHVVLNFTFLDGQLVSPTPIFLGANPAVVAGRGFPSSRPCAEEEHMGYALLHTLDDSERARAVVCEVAPPDFVLMNLAVVPQSALPGEAGALPPIQREFDAMAQADRQSLRFERSQPRGLAGRDMSKAARHVLSTLIGNYLERLPEDLEAIQEANVERTSIDNIHFAWAGPKEHGHGHYYRLQGPSFLVEYDNTQDNANHVHAVWRDMYSDFGMDVLRAHVRGEH